MASDEQTLSEAERLLTAGDLEGARERLWPLRTLRTPDRSAVQIARLLLRARLHRAAEELLDAVLPSIPAGPLRLEALDLHVELKDQLGRSTELLSALDEAITLDPRNASRYFRVIHALDVSRGTDEALRAWQLVQARRPKDAGLLIRGGELHRRLGHVDEARELFRRSLTVGSEMPNLRTQAARALMSVGLLDEAWQQTELQLSADPKHLEAWLVRTRINLWKGYISDARTLITRALELQPDNLDFLRERAAANVLEGQLEAALPDLDHVLSRNGSDFEARLWRAELFFRQGRDLDALQEATRAAESAPGDHFIALLLRYVIKQHLGPTVLGGSNPYPHSVPDSVEPCFCSDLSADAAFPSLFAMVHEESADSLPVSDRRRRIEMLVGLLRRFRGNRSPHLVVADADPKWFPYPADARTLSRDAVLSLPIAGELKSRELLDRVRANWPDSEYQWTYGGEIDLWLGRYTAAGERFREALKKHTMVRWGYIGLTAVAMLEGRYEDAVSQGDEGVRLSGPPGPTYWIYRGEALRRLGRKPEALEVLRRACEINPTRVSAWMNLALLYGANGDLQNQRETLARVERQAPGILVDAERETGVSLWTAPVGYTVENVTTVLEQALKMMRGNRSSARVTYFTSDGAMRALPFIRSASK